jgi:DNA-binding LacI/PurR family transcriptional regulator
LLSRKDNGRIAVTRTLKAHTRVRTIGFLAPSVFSKDHQLWYFGVAAALDGLEAKLRPLTYAHWGDPVIHQALKGMDGLFFVPHNGPTPKWLADKIREASCRTVILDVDESAAKLPSVLLFPTASIRKLLKHLFKLGHRRIDCLNTQAENPVIKERIEIWRAFLNRHGLSGKLRSASIRRPIPTAYATIRKALRDRGSTATAQFCTTGPAAIGAMRAFHEAGLEIGRDVSVCAVNDEGLAPFLLKTLTSLASPPRDKYLRPIARWIVDGGTWSGPLLVQPREAPLFIGESTGPAPKDVHVRARRSSRRKG